MNQVCSICESGVTFVRQASHIHESGVPFVNQVCSICESSVFHL